MSADPVAGFREEVRAWIADHLVGEFARWRGHGGIGREDLPLEVQLAWERELAAGGWVGLGYPAEYGGRPATLDEQVAFHEELAASRAPARLGNVGATLLGPTLLAFGTPEQRARFVPGIVAATEHWCQGYSEPDAGSDLAGIRTRAELDGTEWVVHGQKVWCTLAHVARWCFLLARTDPESSRHHGLSYLLVATDQPGFAARPIRQPTGGAEFSELFLDGARTSTDLVVGGAGNGWKVAMGTLGFERGVGSLGMQLSFAQQLDDLIGRARRTGVIDDPAIRDGLARSWSEVRIMRYTAARTLAALGEGPPGPAASISKLYWSQWYQRFGELAMAVRGTGGLVSDDQAFVTDPIQQTFLFGRAVTIFAGSSEIQRNILGESVLGLAREPR